MTSKEQPVCDRVEAVQCERCEHINERVQRLVDDHKRDVAALKSGGTVDRAAFAERRRKLYAMDDEVRTMLSLAELGARDLLAIERRSRESESGDE